MAHIDSEARYERALGALKRWSEIVGILTTWTALLTIALVASNLFDGMNQRVDAATGMTRFEWLDVLLYPASAITAIGAWIATYVYSARVFWFLYCSLSRSGSVGRSLPGKAFNVASSLLICIPLFAGVLTVAAFIAQTTLNLNQRNDRITYSIDQTEINRIVE